MANLTLSVDDDLLKQARIYAIQHDTSVNALVRAYLESLVAQAKDVEQAERVKAVAEMNRLSDELARSAVIPDGYTWNREELYEERMSRWNRE